MMNKITVYSMSALYFLAGINHFVNPTFYINLILDYANPSLWVTITGVAEILLAAGILFRQTRRPSAWLLVIMLVIFFFAVHLPMAVQYYREQNDLLWLAAIRLPIQILLILWAMKVLRINDTFPFQDKKA